MPTVTALLLGLRPTPIAVPDGSSLYAGRRRAGDIDAVCLRPGDHPLPAPGAPFAGSTVVRAYRVHTVAHWDDGLAPGLTRFAFVARLPGLTAETFRSSYENHAPVARVQHPGICRYVQHFVVDGTEPVCAAISELHFEDDVAVRDRFYRDEHSAAVVDDDISGYLDRERTWSLVTTPVG